MATNALRTNTLFIIVSFGDHNLFFSFANLFYLLLYICEGTYSLPCDLLMIMILKPQILTIAAYELKAPPSCHDMPKMHSWSFNWCCWYPHHNITHIHINATRKHIILYGRFSYYVWIWKYFVEYCQSRKTLS